MVDSRGGDGGMDKRWCGKWKNLGAPVRDDKKGPAISTKITKHGL